MTGYLDEKRQNVSIDEQDKAPTSTLEQYFVGGSTMTTNADMALRHLEDAQSRLFCSPEKMKFDILDVLEDGKTTEGLPLASKVTFNGLQELKDFLKTDTKTHTRFISICAPNSVKPLQITSDGMRELLTAHKIGTDLLDLLLSFANGGKEAEAGPGSLTFKRRPNGVVDMQYRLDYIEQAGNSWASRQVGVYHRRVATGPGNLWIFLHPKNNSILQKRLEAAVMGSPRRDSNWPITHLLVLSSYFGDWRWFLKSLGGEIAHLASDALSLNFSSAAHAARGLEALQSLHHLEEKVLPLSARLRSILTTVTTLKQNENLLFPKGGEGNEHTLIVSDELREYETRVRGHLASVELLEKRVQEILKLLSIALSLNSQATATNINRNILSLTKDTVDDSATVRVVTIVTLIYLPVSFSTVRDILALMAASHEGKLTSLQSFLGMNLFTFQSQANPDGGFQISSQFWIFIILAIPLTFLTVGSWYWMAQRRRKQKAIDQAGNV